MIYIYIYKWAYFRVKKKVGYNAIANIRWLLRFIWKIYVHQLRIIISINISIDIPIWPRRWHWGITAVEIGMCSPCPTVLNMKNGIQSRWCGLNPPRQERSIRAGPPPRAEQKPSPNQIKLNGTMVLTVEFGKFYILGWLCLFGIIKLLIYFLCLIK